MILSFSDCDAKLKYILLNNFYVYGPTSMKLILHLVSKVSKGESQISGQGPITLGVMSLGRFSNFKMHFALNNFYVCGPTSTNHAPHFISKVRKV